MPRSMKMAEIKRILKLAEEEPGLSERKMGEIIGCSKNTIKAIKSIANRLNVNYFSIKDMNEKEIHHLFYPNNNPYESIPTDGDSLYDHYKITISKKNGRLVKTPDIVSRAFIYLDNSEDLIGKIRHYLRVKAEHTVSTDPALKDLKEEIKEDVTHILYDATGHTPIVIPVINKV